MSILQHIYLLCLLCNLALAGKIANQGNCDAAYVEMAKPNVWDMRTDRRYEAYREYLVRMNQEQADYPPYGEDRIISGEHSLLSLGEGSSDFIFTLLDKRQGVVGRETPIENLLAVDISYRDEESPGNHRFPDNYLPGLYQTMDLRHADGSQKQFDEVISLYSLGFVLHSNTKDHRLFLSFSERAQILENTLKHVKSGGVLRIVPGTRGLVDREGVRNVLEHLKRRGIIEKFEMEMYYIVAVKK